jgi:hypothetical protein
VLGKPIHEGDINKNTSTRDNLMRLVLQPMTEDYCLKNGLGRVDELNARIKDERTRRMAGMFVSQWELQRHLYEKHGGRVEVSAKQLPPPLLWGHQAANGEPVNPRTMGAENPSVYAAAGTVHLSIEDYAKYARWQLAGKPTPVLRSQKAFDHLHRPQVDYDKSGAKYACGWICMDTEFGPALNHARSNTNSWAVIWILPDSDFAAIVCTNSGQPQAYAACEEIISFLKLSTHPRTAPMRQVPIQAKSLPSV